jgi:hypothetical protein
MKGFFKEVWECLQLLVPLFLLYMVYYTWDLRQQQALIHAAEQSERGERVDDVVLCSFFCYATHFFQSVWKQEEIKH